MAIKYEIKHSVENKTVSYIQLTKPHVLYFEVHQPDLSLTGGSLGSVPGGSQLQIGVDDSDEGEEDEDEGEEDDEGGVTEDEDEDEYSGEEDDE